MGAVTYESSQLLHLNDSSNGILQCWLQLELVAYESGRKESFDCMMHFFAWSEILLK